MEGIVGLVINLLIGAVGGNLAGAALKAKKSWLIVEFSRWYFGRRHRIFRAGNARHWRWKYYLASTCSIHWRRCFVVCRQSHSQIVVISK